jgi:chemotaxis protein methyltransferase CheR
MLSPTSAPLPVVMPTVADVTPKQLESYAKLIYEKIGVTISPQKTTLLSNRLRRRLRATGLATYDEYYKLLKNAAASDPEWEAFLQEVTTHETYLFRDQIHWDWLRDKFVPEIVAEQKAGKRQAKLRVWSAACSTGDEATTIACCLADRLPAMPAWQVEILGTDVGAGAVAQAQQAAFSERAMRLVPKTYRQRFFDKGTDGACASLKAPYRKMLQFKTHNLLEPLAEQPFDLVVLKNVLIYFDAASKKRVLAQIKRVLRPGGYLITGAAEGVSDLVGEFETTSGWLHRWPGGGTGVTR